MVKYLIIIILMAAVPASGQVPGDFNCDGMPYTLADLIWFGNFMANCDFDSMPQCMVENSDIDEDSRSLTIADFYIFIRIIADGGNYEPMNFQIHPIFDSLRVESAVAHPGDNLALAVYLETVDTLTAFQFCLAPDTDLITIDSIQPMEDLPNLRHNCFGYNHLFSFDFGDLNDSLLFLPGSYQVAQVFVSIDSNVAEPLTGRIEFTSFPPHGYYTGLANLRFFTPILKAGIINIMTTGIGHDDSGLLPSEPTISAYPNPFNSSLKITVTDLFKSQLVIYDILGRIVKTFPDGSFNGNIYWDATDDYGRPVGAGVYFIAFKNSPHDNVKKVIYLK